ncbi:MAG TPA: penicillin-binding transpeptidase domain-containing protein [Bacteroidota bacterium]|nr:penicillin-binding transpeptidase domain-containing protein [Bacteroidota bacterium]
MNFQSHMERWFPADPAARYRRRLTIVKVAFVSLFLLVAFRLVMIQVVDSSTYREAARKQYEARVTLPAVRGSIYDRDGNILASTSTFVSFSANPQIVEDDDRFIAKQFSLSTGKPESEYRQKLQSNRSFVYLERHVRPDVASKIPLGKMAGVIKMNEPVRLYHYGEFAAQIIGGVNSQSAGISGIEREFDPVLKGADGFVIMQRDGLGRKRPSTDYPRQEPVNGHSVFLTIDFTYQSIAEEELKKGIAQTNAQAGLVVMIKPSTGEVLAMASAPTTDLNSITNPDGLKNRTIGDLFEPGSVFKIVTASAALQAKAVSLSTHFYAEMGTYLVPLGNGKTRRISDTHKMGDVTFAEAMAHSSNIVMAKASNLIGAERLYTQARNFGFGIATGIELPGEINGDLKKPAEWSGTTLNSMAYGYEVGVTPLQIVSAYAAVANGGVLMKPYVLKKEVDAAGVVVREGAPQMIRRVMPEEVAEQVKSMLIGVVEFGTGKGVKIAGTTIAGKTGTSRKYGENGYEQGAYNASFVGFLPAERPEVAILVILEKPSMAYYTGALASVPVFRSIAERIINNNGALTRATMADASTTGRSVLVPDVSTLSVESARAMLEKIGVTVRITGNGPTVCRQSPAPGVSVASGESVELITIESTQPGIRTVPDLRGMSLRRAANRLATEKLVAILSGSGVVVSQSPEAGTPIRDGVTTVSVRCEPRHISTAQLY